MRRIFVLVALVLCCAAAVSCAHQMRRVQNAFANRAAIYQATVNATATIPPGPQGELIAYGRDLLSDTPRYAGKYITARMSCAACHVSAGTVPHAGSLLGTYALFPQWNKRANRFIAIQDRLAECFLYSMNGKPPAYYSREMIALTAYIAWLSRGAPVGSGFAGQGPLRLKVSSPPNVADGEKVYAAKCIECHGQNGAGSDMDPPLWGPTSFNDRAGMNRLDRIAPFIRVAMPANAPGTLTDQEATDVAAFILGHPRPKFKKQKLVEFDPKPSAFF